MVSRHRKWFLNRKQSVYIRKLTVSITDAFQSSYLRVLCNITCARQKILPQISFHQWSKLWWLVACWLNWGMYWAMKIISMIHLSQNSQVMQKYFRKLGPHPFTPCVFWLIWPQRIAFEKESIRLFNFEVVCFTSQWSRSQPPKSFFWLYSICGKHVCSIT